MLPSNTSGHCKFNYSTTLAPNPSLLLPCNNQLNVLLQLVGRPSTKLAEAKKEAEQARIARQVCLPHLAPPWMLSTHFGGLQQAEAELHSKQAQEEHKEEQDLAEAQHTPTPLLQSFKIPFDAAIPSFPRVSLSLLRGSMKPTSSQYEALAQRSSVKDRGSLLQRLSPEAVGWLAWHGRNAGAALREVAARFCDAAAALQGSKEEEGIAPYPPERDDGAMCLEALKSVEQLFPFNVSWHHIGSQFVTVWWLLASFGYTSAAHSPACQASCVLDTRQLSPEHRSLLVLFAELLLQSSVEYPMVVSSEEEKEEFETAPQMRMSYEDVAQFLRSEAVSYHSHVSMVPNRFRVRDLEDHLVVTMKVSRAFPVARSCLVLTLVIATIGVSLKAASTTLPWNGCGCCFSSLSSVWSG